MNEAVGLNTSTAAKSRMQALREDQQTWLPVHLYNSVRISWRCLNFVAKTIGNQASASKPSAAAAVAQQVVGQPNAPPDNLAVAEPMCFELDTPCDEQLVKMEQCRNKGTTEHWGPGSHPCEL